MYYLIHWPILLNEELVSASIDHVSSSVDMDFIALINGNDIILYHHKSFSKVLSYARSQDSLDHYGETVAFEWRIDSSCVALGTSGGFVLILNLQLDPATSQQTALSRKENSATLSSSWNSQQQIPALTAQLVDVIDFESSVSCLGSYRDDILVATRDGSIHRLKWDGRILYNQMLNLKQIPFYYDLEHSRASRIVEEDLYCRQVEWCPTLGGLLLLLSNGRAALLNIPAHKLDPSQVEGVWAEHLKHATCMAANVRFRTVAFGGRGGEGVVYATDDATGALNIQHRLRISSREYPDAAHVTGAVNQLRWSPDGYVLAMVWDRAGFALWSVHGTLLLSTLGEKLALGREMNIGIAEWGPEGYTLWNVASFAQDPNRQRRHIVVFNFAKCALASNPSSDNHEHLVLQSSDSLYMSHRADLAAGRQWHVAQFPNVYLNSNWPIRYTAIDPSGRNVVVAGKRGIAHYSLQTRRWKLFGNETQEKALQVTGGLCWWKEFICLACVNIGDRRDELRVYSSHEKLDNLFAQVFRLPSEALLINTFRNLLTILCADGHVNLYTFVMNTEAGVGSAAGAVGASGVRVEKLQEVSLISCLPYPVCVVGLTLSCLRSEISASRQPCLSTEVESLLVNYAGRLLMFQRDRSSGPGGTASGGQQQGGTTGSTTPGPSNSPPTLANHNIKPLPFCNPIVVASSVELMWTTPPSDTKQPPAVTPQCCRRGSVTSRWSHYLSDSLWLNCGAQGMRVWLPLFSGRPDQARTPGFMSRRIMLNFNIDIYPLVVLFEEALVLGALNDFHFIEQQIQSQHVTDAGHSGSARGTSDEEPNYYAILPHALLSTSSQIYLHHIVKQLLRKNLGVHALELSMCCRELPYFHHVLELLLHEVLEEEATSKEPIPDPLLPRAVAFIHEFREFLDTVAQCARKTEVALWPYLFSSVGNPKDLFESCLMAGELDTAASYLIILQNTEKPMMSKQHALLLLDATLVHARWDLVDDLLRFLRTIDPQDLLSPGATGPSSGSSVSSGSGAIGVNASTGVNVAVETKSRCYTTSVTTSARPGELPVGPLFDSSPPPPSEHGSHNHSVRQNSFAGPGTTSGGVEQQQVGAATVSPGLANGTTSAGAGGTRKNRRHHHSQPQTDLGVRPPPLPPVPALPTGEPGTTVGSGPLPSPITLAMNVCDEVEALLSRHARKLIAAYRVFDLATFAANTRFTRGQLVVWLAQERTKSARVKDFVAALRALHRDFQWPLPIFVPRVPTPSSGLDPELLLGHPRHNYTNNWPHAVCLSSDGGVATYPADEVFLKPNTRVVPGVPRPWLPPADPSPSTITNSPLRDPTSDPDTASLLGGAASSLSGAGTELDVTTGGAVTPDCSGYLDLLTNELANMGSDLAHRQLHYVLRVFMEAGCLDWAMVVSILLRDAGMVGQVVEGTGQWPGEAGRLARGVEEIEAWTDVECAGYKTFLIAVRPYVSILLNQSSAEITASNAHQLLTTRRVRQTSTSASGPRPPSDQLASSATAAMFNLENSSNSVDEVVLRLGVLTLNTDVLAGSPLDHLGNGGEVGSAPGVTALKTSSGPLSTPPASNTQPIPTSRQSSTNRHKGGQHHTNTSDGILLSPGQLLLLANQTNPAPVEVAEEAREEEEEDGAHLLTSAYTPTSGSASCRIS